MTEPESEFVVRRILVALDASAQSLAALKTSVKLAAELGAELEGLFVEDANLMRIAMLPFARRMLFPSAAEEPLDSSVMEHELKSLARRAQRSLATMAEHYGIQWSFRVVRGKVTIEILSAASDSDLLTVGSSGWSMTRRMQLGSTAQNAAIHAPGALLLAKCPLAVDRPVMVLFDGSPPAEQALKAAIRFASALQSQLTVFLLPDTPPDVRPLMRGAAHQITAKGVDANFRALLAIDALRLADAIEVEAGGLLVLGREYKHLTENEVQNLIRLVSNPVLLLRQPAVRTASVEN
jgi:nucleotide-binding universal stress UspA family protein